MSTDAIKFLEKMNGRLTLGGSIWAIRKCDEISQIEFAKTLGVSKQYLCDLEHDRKRVSAKQAAKFAEVLGYPPVLFIKFALQDQLYHDGLKFEIELKAVA